MADPTAEDIRAPNFGPPLASIAGELADIPCAGATFLSPRQKRKTGIRQDAPQEDEEDHVSRNGRSLVLAALRRLRTDFCSIADNSRKRTGRGAQEAELFQARCRNIVIRTPLRRNRGRRQFRRRPSRRECGQHPSSRLAHKNHDAVSAVRAARGRTADAREQIDRVRKRDRTGADQARPQGRANAVGRRCHQGAGHKIGERRRRRDCRGACRQRRGIRQGDDAQGARARHEPHGLQERLRLAGRRSGHHRPRPGPARDGDPGPLPEILSLLRDQRLQMARRFDAQPQPPARQGRRRGRHQDRLYARIGLQSCHLGQTRQAAPRGGRSGRTHGRRPRRPHARIDRSPCRRRRDQPHGAACRRGARSNRTARQGARCVSRESAASRQRNGQGGAAAKAGRAEAGHRHDRRHSAGPAGAGARIDRTDQAQSRENPDGESERIPDGGARAGVAVVADAGDVANACRAWRAQ